MRIRIRVNSTRIRNRSLHTQQGIINYATRNCTETQYTPAIQKCVEEMRYRILQLGKYYGKYFGCGRMAARKKNKNEGAGKINEIGEGEKGKLH